MFSAAGEPGPADEAIECNAAGGRQGTTFGKPSERTEQQHDALGKLMRSGKKAIKYQRQASELQAVVSETAVAVKGEFIDKPGQMEQVLKVAHSGIVNATVSSRVFGMARSTINKFWKCGAAAFLLMQLMLLRSFGQAAAVAYHIRGKMLSHTQSSF